MHFHGHMISWDSPSVGSDQAEQFQSFFTVKTRVPASPPVPHVPASLPALSHEDEMIDDNINEICQGYISCYVLVERSARLELGGYDSIIWHVVFEACTSNTQ